MAYELVFTQTAADHLRTYRKSEQKRILDTVEKQLLHEPTKETKNRKRLGENEWSDWELRAGKFRVFDDIVTENDRQMAKIKAVGHKEHNTLFIGDKETHL